MPEHFRLNPKLKGTARLKRCDWPNCGAACCIYGAWVDRFHAEDILKHHVEIGPHLALERRHPASWFDGQAEPDDYALSGTVVHTTIIPNPEHYGGTSCIFLRKDQKCALQVAAEENGEHPWRWKPFYCILHPLDLDDDGRITLDDPDVLVKEPASCLKPSRKEIPMMETFKQELTYLLGKQVKFKRP